MFIAIVLLSLLFSLLSSIDWSQIGGPLVMLAIMLGFLYWTTTLLPGPVKKVGKAAGRMTWRAITRKGKK